MRTTIHLHPQPDDFSAGHGGPGKYHPGYATVDMESGDVEAVIFLDSAAKCDALIKAAVEAKRLLLGDTIPPALEQDLVQADADPANPYSSNKHGEFTATSAAAVAEDVDASHLAPPAGYGLRSIETPADGVA